MVVLGYRIRPGEEDNHPAVVVEDPIHPVAVAVVPILLVAAEDLLEEGPILPAVVVVPILLVAAADHQEEVPNYLAVVVAGPNCPAADRSLGFVADNHLRMGVEGGRRMTFLVI